MDSLNQALLRLHLHRYNKIPFYLSGLVALLQFITALTGIIFAKTIYPASIRATFVGNDYANLLFGEVTLIISLFLVYRSSLLGLYGLLASLFYTLYAYFAYLIAVPFGYTFLLYLLLVTISLYTLIMLISIVDPQEMFNRLDGKIRSKLLGGILIVLGIFILLRELGLIFSNLSQATVVDEAEVLAVWIDDFLFAVPALLLCGILLWKKLDIGYLLAPALFLSYALLSLALLPIIIAQNVEDHQVLDIPTIIVLAIMFALCFFPYLSVINKIKSSEPT